MMSVFIGFYLFVCTMFVCLDIGFGYHAQLIAEKNIEQIKHIQKILFVYNLF